VRRIVLDRRAPLLRSVFVTPALLVRVDSDGRAASIDRLSTIRTEGDSGSFSQLDGYVTVFFGTERVRMTVRSIPSGMALLRALEDAHAALKPGDPDDACAA